MPGVVGRKNWDCSISLREDANTKTVIHELLHARSVSYYNVKAFQIWREIEEGTVELYAQEICEKNRIAWKGSYLNIVKKLRAINQILGICENDYDFAKQLFDIEMPNRYNWLISKYREKEGNISEKQKRNFEKLVEYFRREEHL